MPCPIRSGLAVAIAALGIALALPAAPSHAQRAAWDQDRVTELAIQLADEVAELQSAFRREPPANIASGQSRARHRFRDGLRVLRTETRALASELEAGAGLDETQPIALRSRQVIRGLREEARRMGLKEPALGHAVRAEEIISQLAPFYFDVEGGAGEAGGEAAEDAAED